MHAGAKRTCAKIQRYITTQTAAEAAEDENGKVKVRSQV
jgi:hypothetical protein